MFFQKNINETINKIQDDILDFVETELQVHLSNNSNTGLNNSVIANLAMFDLEAIYSEQGYMQMDRLLGNHYDQMVERRTRQLLHMLYIKYGNNAIENIRKRVIDTMSIAYPKALAANCRSLDKKHNTFWMVPFIKEAYNNIVLAAKK
jgi:hypothetical protein